MKKKITLLLLISALALSVNAGCTPITIPIPAMNETSQSSEASQTSEISTFLDDVPDAGDIVEQIGKPVQSDDDDSSDKPTTSGILMSVDKSSGSMNISRAATKATPMGSSDTWTVFVYLCGTDLESCGQSSATRDVEQMLLGKTDSNVRFVIQTGGTEKWMNDTFSERKAERYVIENEDITLADSIPVANMGDPDTLSDFLSWGVSNYPAEKMGVIFWDHGSGSINGVCFDELNEYDSLSLSELNEAFSEVYSEMTDKFEFIGFDACLMGTVETANILSTYARYMYGSQESEPGTGWDYTTIADFLTENPETDGAELGKTVADSFYDECKLTGSESSCTMTVVDLQKIDDFVIAFNDFSNRLYNASLDEQKLNQIVRGISSADNFGGNNKSEGYTNMVDIGGIITQCSDIVDGSEALSALRDCIYYNKNGTDHYYSEGLSTYFPLELGGSSELYTFSQIAISPYYLSMVDMIANGYSAYDYDNSVFFGSDNVWESDNCQIDDLDDTYFDYADETEDDDSTLITFDEAPTFDDDGNYYFILDNDGLMYTSNVTAFLLLDVEDTLVMIGESYDIYADWEQGIFADDFDGLWLSLPNGQILTTYVVDITANYVIYTCPIYLNGERTNLRLRQSSSGLVVEGTWDGISDEHSAAKGIRKLQDGDEIEVIYTLDDDSEITADPYEWSKDDTIYYSELPASDYYYAFCIEDIYGDYLITDPVMFTIDDDGTIYFSEVE